MSLEEEDLPDSGNLSDAQKWLSERHQPGNWLAIGPGDEIPHSIDGWDRTIIHMFQIAFTPEIQRRMAAGVLEPDFFVQSAQMLQPPDGKQIIRFNDEVRGIMRLRLDRDVTEHEPILVSDLRNFESFDVLEEEMDCGHFTILWNGASWILSFDFRSGRGKSAQTIDLASQFFSAARFSSEQGHAGASIDNLFSACELIVKAELILQRHPAVKSKKHGRLSSAINAWGMLGNIESDFLKLYNRLSNHRSSARYEAAADTSLPTGEELKIVAKKIEVIRTQVAQRT